MITVTILNNHSAVSSSSSSSRSLQCWQKRMLFNLRRTQERKKKSDENPKLENIKIPGASLFRDSPH
jgi:hypothetical protein